MALVAKAEQSGNPDTIADANKRLIPLALAMVANDQMLQGKYQEAIDSYERSLQLEDTASSRLGLALVYMRAGRTNDGLAEVAKVIAADPKNADAWNLQGKLQMDAKQYTAAAESLTHSYELQPNFDVASATAQAFLSAKQPDKAQTVFANMASASGNPASLHILAGRAYQNSGYTDQAIAEYKEAIKIDPSGSRGHYFLGMLYLMQNEWTATPQAREEFAQEVTLNPKDFFGNYFMGYILAGESKFNESDRYLKVAAAARPDWPEPWLYMGLNAYGRGERDQAEELLKKAVALTGDDLARNNYQIRRAYSVLGHIANAKGHKEEAAADAKVWKEMEAKALAQSSAQTPAGRTSGGGMSGNAPPLEMSDAGGKSDAIGALPALTDEQKKELQQQEQQLRVILGKSFNDLGTAEARKQQYDLALVHFQEAEKWNPDTPRVTRNVGLAAFRAQKYAECVRAMKVVVAQDPQDKTAWAMLAMAAFSSEQYADAVKAFDVLGDAPMADPRMAYARAYSLAQTNEPQQAGAILDKLAAQNPPPDMLILVGQVYAFTGDQVHALQCFQKAAQLDPALKRAHYFAGVALIRQDKPAEAIPELQAELKMNPGDVDSQYNLAYALLQTNQPEQALPLLRSVVEKQPRYAPAQYELGKTLLEKGQVQEAIQHLEIAAQINPDLDYVHYQLQMAYRKAGRTADADREAKLYRDIKDHKRANSTTAH